MASKVALDVLQERISSNFQEHAQKGAVVMIEMFGKLISYSITGNRSSIFFV